VQVDRHEFVVVGVAIPRRLLVVAPDDAREAAFARLTELDYVGFIFDGIDEDFGI
jgi:hypothetical protein